jgi:hypothetical protein
MVNDHRQWLYKDGKGRIFEVGEEIPFGWTDHPDNVVEKQLENVDREEPEEPQKYPSQMNKAELIELGKTLNLDLVDDMTKREMLNMINAAMKE